jgi:hypothetical protein
VTAPRERLLLRVPQPTDPSWPRYSARPLPAYPYVPGVTPHPRRDARGHSYGAPDPIASPWRPEQWTALEPWLYGVDLFNYAYWWEAHEQLEALWLAAGRTTEHARFVQGLIKIAAACLNAWVGKVDIARAQSDAGMAAMIAAARAHGSLYMGIDLGLLQKDVAQWQGHGSTAPPLIALHIDAER